MTLYVALPLGTLHGWGVAGRMITRELARRSNVEFYTQPIHPEFVADEAELQFLISLLPPGTDPMNPSKAHAVEGPVLRGIPALDRVFYPELRGPFNVGYTFFEDNLILDKAKPVLGDFDHLVAGCTWCANSLKAFNYPNVSVILQGIEPTIFNAHMNEKRDRQDQFVIFSGGKLEIRKGQDIVIRAVQTMQQRHKDVFLVNAWFNQWSEIASTISASRHIRIPTASGEFTDVVNALLAFNGLDMSRVLSLGARPNPTMAEVYKNTDIGLFPNRCEGGTNLVLCEYMACGKPVIAAYNTGHMDILTDENSIPIRNNTSFKVTRPEYGQVSAEWYEPDLNEVVDKLEWAYQNREKLKPLADRAGSDLAKLTWSATGEQFHQLLTGGISSR